MSLGLAKSTIKAYDSAWYFYSNFCASLLPLPFPVDISDFCCKEWLCFLSSLPCWNSSICAPHLTGLLPCSWSMAVIPWRDPGSPPNSMISASTAVCLQVAIPLTPSGSALQQQQPSMFHPPHWNPWGDGHHRLIYATSGSTRRKSCQLRVMSSSPT